MCYTVVVLCVAQADPWLVMSGAGTHSPDTAHTPTTTTTGSTDATATIIATAPGAPAPPARRSLSYGTRVLLALVSAVERLTGAPDAVSSLTVVLHVTDAQREQVGGAGGCARASQSVHVCVAVYVLW